MADTEAPAPADAPAGDGSGSPDAANSGGTAGPGIPTMDDIKNFRCDCVFTFLPVWEQILDIIEGVVKINKCCICIPLDLRLCCRITGLGMLVQGVQTLLWGLDLLSPAFHWGLAYIGLGVALIWASYLLWRGGAFCWADNLAIFLNVQSWIMILMAGFSLFMMITGDFTFGQFFQQAIITTLVWIFMTSHITKFYRILEGKVDNDEWLGDLAEWKADADNTPFHGCCFGGGGGGGGGGDGAKEAESQPA
jgi:hypothetical protein